MPAAEPSPQHQRILMACVLDLTATRVSIEHHTCRNLLDVPLQPRAIPPRRLLRQPSIRLSLRRLVADIFLLEKHLHHNMLRLGNTDLRRPFHWHLLYRLVDHTLQLLSLRTASQSHNPTVITAFGILLSPPPPQLCPSNRILTTLGLQVAMFLLRLRSTLPPIATIRVGRHTSRTR